jgi:hypothetical protein
VSSGLVPTPNIHDGESWPELPPLPAHPPPRRRANLGPTLREFRPPRSWAGWTFATALLAVAVPVAVLMARSGHPIGAALLTAIAAGGAALNLYLGRARRAAGRVVVCEDGLRCEFDGRSVTCAWADVESVAYRNEGNPRPTERLVIARRDATEFEVPATAAPAAEVLRALHAPLRPLLLPPVEQALERDEAAGFGPLLQLEAWGLVWVETPICWADLEAVSCGFHERSRCAVLVARSRLAVSPLDLGAIPNVVLLLELLRDRFGVRVEHAAALIGEAP